MNKILAASTMILSYLVIAVIMAAIIVKREMPKGNEMGTLDILTALVKGGMSPVGACAMGGNMMAESGMKSNIAQRGMTTLTDERYTAAADAGTIDFIGDSVGYGLCQWTYRPRKKNLLDYAKNIGASVGDEGMQVQFCLLELQTDFAALWQFLQTTTDLRIATERICKEFERPAVNNIETRYKYAEELYAQYGDKLGAMQNAECKMQNDAEPASYIMGTVRYGEHTPEAAYLKALLKELGYDVLWEGLNNCLKDFQRRRGLTVDGICGEKTWRELMK